LEHIKDWRLRFAILKENSKYRKFWYDQGGEKILAADREQKAYFEQNPDPIPHVGPNPQCPAAVAIHEFFKKLFSYGIFIESEIPTGAELERLLRVLDPTVEDIPENLPFIFVEPPAVVQVVEKIDWKNPLFIQGGNVKAESDHFESIDFVIDNLRPWHRLLQIDLRRKKTEILSEVEKFIDQVTGLRNEPVPWAANYDEWATDTTRQRQEAWQALEVWRLRRRRKPFNEISKSLGIQYSTAKMAFRRAFELIEGRPYEPEFFNREVQTIQLSEVKRTCATCPRYGKTCNPKRVEDLCPEMLLYVDQDQIKRRELLTR
jgi:hypothetical protein